MCACADGYRHGHGRWTLRSRGLDLLAKPMACKGTLLSTSERFEAKRVKQFAAKTLTLGKNVQDRGWGRPALIWTSPRLSHYRSQSHLAAVSVSFSLNVPASLFTGWQNLFGSSFPFQPLGPFIYGSKWTVRWGSIFSLLLWLQAFLGPFHLSITLHLLKKTQSKLRHCPQHVVWVTGW